jgi:hypothetical protein
VSDARVATRARDQGIKAWTATMDIAEILVLILSVPGMFLLLLILVRVEQWLGEDTEGGWAPRPAAARPLPADVNCCRSAPHRISGVSAMFERSWQSCWSCGPTRRILA